MEKVDYPGIIDRLKASVIDGLIIVALIGASTEIFGSLDQVSNTYKVITVIVIFLYEPITVSLFGASMGHRMCKIKVQNANSGKKINIIQSVIRFLMKSILGWISLFTISSDKQNKAMHDLVVNSVVVYDEDYI